MKILVLVEHNPGGELKATQSLLSTMENNGAYIQLETLAPLVKTGLVSYLSWILRSVIRSAGMAWKYRSNKVVYTTTYTALLGAELVRPFTRQRLCFHYHGSRIPPKTVANVTGFRSLTQRVKHDLVKFLHMTAWSAADLFVAPSLQIIEALSHEFKVLGKRVAVIPNGVDTRRFVPISEEEQALARKQYHIPQRAFVCLVISRIDPDKKIIESLELIRTLQENCRKQVLLLLATPSRGNDQTYMRKVQQTLTNTEIPHYIFVDHPRLQELYQLSDCVLSHSAKEVFPLVLLEAAAVGIPYFASKNGVVEKYLEQIDPGLVLVDSKLAAVRQVLANTHKRKLSDDLRQFALTHTWQASASKLLMNLREL